MKTLDIPIIGQELNVEGFATPRKLNWLHESYSSPVVFWHELKCFHNNIFSWPSKSNPLENYDFYHDIITRNKSNKTSAFISYDYHTGWEKTSYSELGLLVDRKACYLKSMEVKQGQKICIVLPVCLEYVVSLLASLKLGLTISSLPPQGSAFVKKRLEILAPDYILTNHIYSLLLPDFHDKLLIGDGVNGDSETKSEESFSYTSGSVLGLFFDPNSSTPHIPKELTCDAAYLCPLRDGLITFGILPGYVFSAPGLHFLETQPALILSVLLNGGTYLNIEPEDIEKNTDLLNVHPIHSILITSKVRDILLHKPFANKVAWRLWFRSPLESVDIDEWQHFIQDLKLEKVYVGNVVCSAAFGGCQMFSARREGYVNSNVLPSAGVPWTLLDFTAKDSDGGGDFGIFSFVMMGRNKKELFSTGNILNKNRKEWLLGGSLIAMRAGRSYPVDEILDTITKLQSCEDCSIVEIPNPGSVCNVLFILLVFNSANMTSNKLGILQDIKEKIVVEMGEEFLPDKIQFIPTQPKRLPCGNIDHDRCRSEYITGSLFRKSNDEIYLCLDKLRKYI